MIKPEVGSILVTNEGSVGHVAVVEEIHDDGTVTISEQNFHGWNVVTKRTLDVDDPVVKGIIH